MAIGNEWPTTSGAKKGLCAKWRLNVSIVLRIFFLATVIACVTQT